MSPTDAYVRRLAELGAEIMHVPVEDVLGQTREMGPALVRHALMYVLRERGWTLAAIGAALHRDHSSVHNGWLRLRARIAVDSEACYLVDELLYAAVAEVWPHHNAADRRRLEQQLEAIDAAIAEAERARTGIVTQIAAIRERANPVITRGRVAVA